MTPSAFKEAVVKETRRRMERDCPVHIPQACLCWAKTLVQVLRSYHIRGVVQAGSCSWPRIPMEEDDGIVMTHFSYQFELQPALAKLMRCEFPEMHVWVAIAEEQEIIDLTTCYLPENCKKLAGIEWTGKLPPDYLWASLDDIPEDVLYVPNLNAIQISLELMRGI